MDKEMEELVLLGVGAFVLLQLLKGGGAASALSLAKLQTQQDTAYAADGASVLNTAIADFSGD